LLQATLINIRIYYPHTRRISISRIDYTI